ncbi:MAG: hypothetical protein J6036_04680 [Clostridia bacterium]|nr:hypothetical protein [Clostridia bacterium]
MKKLIISLLIVAAVLSLGVYAYTGTGTQANPYMIETKEDLQVIAAASASNSLKNKYFKQTANIAFGTENFTGIGSEDHPFMGNYDGCGYTISGTNVTCIGIFNVAKDARIANLNSEIKITADNYIGGIVGKALGQTVITDCTFNGIISVPENNMILSSRIGGIAGFAETAVTIQKCENFASVNVNSVPFITYVGGIVGQNYGSVNSCKNNASVTVCSDTYLVAAGGIAGHNGGVVNYCFNYGNVSGETSNDLAAVYTGGICGYNEGGVLSAVQNTASVLVTNYGKYPGYAGGICGYNEGGIINVVRNDGTIISEGAYAGGIVGLNLSTEQVSVVDNAINKADVTGSSGIAGGIAGVNMSIVEDSAEALVSGSVNLNDVYGGNAIVGSEITSGGATSTVENVYALSGSDDNATFLTADQFTNATSLTGLDANEWVFPSGFNPNIAIAADNTEFEIIFVDHSDERFAFSVYNPGSSTSATAIISYYNSGRLVGISISGMSLQNGYTTCSVASPYAGSDNIKVMVLDSLTGLIPLVKPLQR